MHIRFDGRVAIVTGAGSGIGRLEAIGLAARGARVVVNDFAGPATQSEVAESAERVAAEIRQRGGEAIAIGADVADVEQVDQLVARTRRAWGRIDILINNAGVMSDAGVAEMSPADFRRVVDVNLTGAFVCSRAVWPQMREAKFGRILMTTSSSGLFGSPRQANYGPSKLALVALMNALHLEGRRHNIRVNSLAPAAVTPMNQALLPADHQRVMKAEAVIPAALYLVSEDAPSKVILTAAAGGFSRVYIEESEPFFLSSDSWTPEAVADHMAAFGGSGVRLSYESSFDQVSRFFGRAAEQLDRG